MTTTYNKHRRNSNKICTLWSGGSSCFDFDLNNRQLHADVCKLTAKCSPAMPTAGSSWACAECSESSNIGLSAFCSLAVDATGRFQFAFSASCATRSVASALGAAFLFYDAALIYIAAYGGAFCFDNSNWSRVFNISSTELMRSQAKILEGMDATSGLPRTAEGVLRAECPMPKTKVNPEQYSEDAGKGWNRVEMLITLQLSVLDFGHVRINYLILGCSQETA